MKKGDVVRHYVGVFRDISKSKQDEERIRYQANFDALTGLANRSLFHDRLSQAVASARRKDTRVGLMFLDLDGFKLVNDTLGHDRGDMLLIEAGKRIQSCVRDNDTVARLGGDEFTVILVDAGHTMGPQVVAQRVLESLAGPFMLEGQEAFISASIGITVFPEDAADAKGLLKNADAAMYQAKEKGKANYQFFTQDLNADAVERLVIRNGLIKGLGSDEFELFYQPKLSLETGDIVGAEALLRWHSPTLGWVPPVRFIPVLEEAGMIRDIGYWILETACKQYATLRDAGYPGVRIAVNLSPRQLHQPNIVEIIQQAMDSAGIEPSGLEVEITESMLMTDPARVAAFLGEIQAMGVHIAMDDFGTGYSSLSYLKRFPIDTIKIDRSFVADISEEAEDVEIVRAIINMGHALGREIVAEGVETEEQAEVLRDFRCEVLQGYLVSRPRTSSWSSSTNNARGGSRWTGLEPQNQPDDSFLGIHLMVARGPFRAQRSASSEGEILAGSAPFTSTHPFLARIQAVLTQVWRGTRPAVMAVRPARDWMPSGPPNRWVAGAASARAASSISCARAAALEMGSSRKAWMMIPETIATAISPIPKFR